MKISNSFIYVIAAFLVSITLMLSCCTLVDSAEVGIKFKKFSFPHTYFSKLNGVCVASSPFLFSFIPKEVVFIIVGTVFFLAGVETLIIVIKLKKMVPFVPSVFHTEKAVKDMEKSIS